MWCSKANSYFFWSQVVSGHPGHAALMRTQVLVHQPGSKPVIFTKYGQLIVTSHLAPPLTRPLGVNRGAMQPQNRVSKQLPAQRLTGNPCADKRYTVAIKIFLNYPCDSAITTRSPGRQPLAGWGLSYSGVVRILFPEQLRAVAERLCRCHVIHSVSILKVSMCRAGVCPGIHRRFPDSLIFFWLKRN